MSVASTSSVSQLADVARKSGLNLTQREPGTDFGGQPTVRYGMTLPTRPERGLLLELSESFDPSDSRFAPELDKFFHQTAERLKNPRPDCFLSLLGLPLSFGQFAWPFHSSTSGADTFIVHGEIRLDNGIESILHAKVSASMTRTFAEVLSALEQPFAESFIYNAVRKTLDQGQLELVKSGNRQPVPVTTRYYSAKQQRFIFNDTTPEQRKHFLAGHVFWMSHALGADAPVWIADPRDAQYLNSTVEDLESAAAQLVKEGLLALDGDRATATARLIEQRPRFEAEVADALGFIKPSFNEEMRAGHTNM